MQYKKTRLSTTLLLTSLAFSFYTSSALAINILNGVGAVSNTSETLAPPGGLGTWTPGTGGAGVWAPGTFGPPKKPTSISVVRDNNQFIIRWRHHSGGEKNFEIFRKVENNGWTLAHNRQVTSADEQLKWTDQSLMADTQYCYKIRAVNQNGKSNFTNKSCWYSKDDKENKVWRVELELYTSSQSDANTDDSVQVRLNAVNPTYNPQGNNTWLDYNRDDFEKGTVYTYDLSLSKIQEMEDITMISLKKSGTNGWCLDGLKLKVNNLVVYSRDIVMETGSCHWIDGNDGKQPIYTINHTQLRAHPDWTNYNHQIAQLIALSGMPNTEITSRIEGLTGDKLYSQQAYWKGSKGSGVEVTRGCAVSETSCQKLHVILGLRADAPYIPDPSVDIAFDLTFQCQDNKIGIKTDALEVDVDQSWFWDILSLGILYYIDGQIEKGVLANWNAISQEIAGVPACPSIEVNANGDVTFSLPVEQLVQPVNPAFEYFTWKFVGS